MKNQKKSKQILSVYIKINQHRIYPAIQLSFLSSLLFIQTASLTPAGSVTKKTVVWWHCGNHRLRNIQPGSPASQFHSFLQYLQFQTNGKSLFHRLQPPGFSMIYHTQVSPALFVKKTILFSLSYMSCCISPTYYKIDLSSWKRFVWNFGHM